MPTLVALIYLQTYAKAIAWVRQLVGFKCAISNNHLTVAIAIDWHKKSTSALLSDSLTLGLFPQCLYLCLQLGNALFQVVSAKPCVRACAIATHRSSPLAKRSTSAHDKPRNRLHNSWVPPTKAPWSPFWEWEYCVNKRWHKPTCKLWGEVMIHRC